MATKITPEKLAERVAHEALIVATAAYLANGQPSVFRREGETRDRLRSQWCLNGWRWDTADAYAELVISLAYQRLKVVRPTWAEGQHEPPNVGGLRLTFCRRCGALLEEKQRLYCSERCRAVGKFLNRPAAARERVLMTIARAQDAWRSRQPPLICNHCDGMFNPKWPQKKGQGPRLFCSHACMWAARRKEARRDDHVNGHAGNGHCGHEERPGEGEAPVRGAPLGSERTAIHEAP